jgi:hypothetical protein
MAVFHQMGHHSNNLIDLQDMGAYAGAIFSPINCTETEAASQGDQAKQSRGNFEIILDPQLYVPATERGKLRKWSYFPKDVDTADIADARWWTDLNKKLAAACKKIEVDAVCSPVVIPKVFDDKYYANCVQVGSELNTFMLKDGVNVLQTALVSFAELGSGARALEIASIISRTDADRVYLVLIGSTPPRREKTEVDELKGAMQLIDALERNHVPVTVGFCSSDILLWKTAGASGCASGKFFNLRRFTRQRFEEPAEGGGQLPYWFEENLMAFLRQGDLLRVRKYGLLSETSRRNPFGQQILAQIDEAERTRTKLKPWLAISWRQFLYWFADVEKRLSEGAVQAKQLLAAADANWSKLDKEKVLMEERGNDGTWVRAWLNGLNEYEASKG